MKRNLFKNIMLTAIGAATILSCTDLEIENTDSAFDNLTGEFVGVDAASQIDGLYTDFRRIGDQANNYALQEVAGDYELVPTRGTDWGDNGIWRTLHAHTWDPGHQYILNVWNNWNNSIFKASEVLDSRTTTTTEQFADASFLRAYATWIIMDAFGVVPFREPDSEPQDLPTIRSRSEAFADVLADLDVAIAGLPDVVAGDIDSQAKASKQAAQFLKARVLLNAHIYDGTGSPDSSNMQEVINLVDAIATQGYALEDDYFDIFEQTADTETIFWLPSNIGNRIWNGMHYNIISPDNDGGGWNGFCVLSDFYDSFEGPSDSNRAGGGQEERRGYVPHPDDNNIETTGGIGFGFLVGQQYDAEGEALKTRPGGPLSFTKELPGLVGNGEETGIRTIKYHPLGEGGSFREHNIVFRYADAHLMKAEAMLRNGGDATAMVNELRTLRSASPLGSVTLDDILAERGRELYKEFIRRTDLVRFDKFTADWQFKAESSVGDASKNIFPIPTFALLSNPNLQQNPGY